MIIRRALDRMTPASIWKTIALLLILCSSSNLSAQTDADSVAYPYYIIRGFVHDSTTGEPILYGTVLVEMPHDTVGVTTDENGFYQIKIKSGPDVDPSKLIVRCRYIGYFESSCANLKFNGNMATLKIIMVEDPTPIEVIAEPAQKISVVKLDPEAIKRIPIIIDPPCHSYEIILPADHFRTEHIVVDEDEF